MVQLKEFTQPEPRALPVLLLLDVSGSMSVEGKIAALNQAVCQMLAAWTNEDIVRAEIQVCTITFGGEARVHMSLQPARDAQANWRDMDADGDTPMGAAMAIAAGLIEDRETIPSRAYRPTVVLVTDGQPTDDWESGLRRLTGEGRARKADRVAMAIGADADEEMLRQYLGDPEKRVFHAEDAARISEFFRWLTMSVTTRSRSVNPNEVARAEDPFSVDTP